MSGLILRFTLTWGGLASAWDGLNPYFRPAHTTDYYGSGDIDLDGARTHADLASLRSALQGGRPSHARMDVDGNGRIEPADETLLLSAVEGARLPSDWDRLERLEDRRSWVKRMLAVDPGNLHPYSTLWQQCVGFSTQLYLRFSGLSSELFATEFSASGAEFNLPVYAVSIISPGFAHAANAVLVGEDPTRLSDWMILEPQNDSEIALGSRWLPVGSVVTIYVPKHLQWAGHEKDERVVFQISEGAATFVRAAPALLRERPRPQPPQAALPTALRGSHPLLLPQLHGTLIVEGRSPDGWGRPSLACLENPFAPSSGPRELATGAFLLRPLSHTALRNGSDYVLWRSDEGTRRYLSGAVLPRPTGSIERPERIATDRSVLTARVVEARDGTLHVVWLEVKTTADHPYATGLYTCRREANAWSAPEPIVSLDRDLDPWHFDTFPDARRYFFDLCRNTNDQLVLVWVQRAGTFAKPEIRERRFGTKWSDSRLVAGLAEPTAGVDLLADASGTVHLAYWSGPSQLNGAEGRGKIRYRRSDGDGWSDEEIIDEANDGFGARLAERPDRPIAVVWDKRTDGRSRVAWSERLPGGWAPTFLLPNPHERLCRYPQAVSVGDELVAVVWEEYEPARPTLGMLYLRTEHPGLPQPTTRISQTDADDGRIGWSAIPGHSYTLETNSNVAPEGWLAAGPPELATDYRAVSRAPAHTQAGTWFLRIRDETQFGR